MNDKKTIFLAGRRQKDYAKELIDQVSEDYVCVLKPKTRTLEQNARFHAMITDVAKQCDYMGKRRSVAQWKLIFISGHAIVTGKGSEIVEGIEGEMINLRESSADMGISRLSSVMEYVSAWGVEHGVIWSEK